MVINRSMSAQQTFQLRSDSSNKLSKSLARLNALIRAVAKTAAKHVRETLGIIGGYDGLLEPQNFRVFDYQTLAGLPVRGVT